MYHLFKNLQKLSFSKSESFSVNTCTTHIRFMILTDFLKSPTKEKWLKQSIFSSSSNFDFVFYIYCLTTKFLYN